jgi:phosphate:Na+ symporter
MQQLLNLFAAIALLVWGTHIVRTGVLRVMGENLRHVLSRSVKNRLTGMLAGLGVAGLLQSSTATCLIVASFVAQGLIPTGSALAVMLGADIGTSLMAVVFSFDLSWLSPLLIVVGVFTFISSEHTNLGRIGRVAIGLGLITLALHLIVAATKPLTQSPAIVALLAALPNELLLEFFVGALLTVLSYSSLAIVLLTATLATAEVLPVPVALGLVLGANLGSGLLAVISTARASPQARRIPIGNLLFKLAGGLLLMPFMSKIPDLMGLLVSSPLHLVVGFHLAYNLALGVTFIGVVRLLGARLDVWLPEPEKAGLTERPRHLDPTALATPSLAISCAAREALHQADIVETMLRGILPVMKENDLVLAQSLRQKDDTVDELYSAIKFYLTQISREALSAREGKRWTDIISFTINMEQIGDIVERVIQDLEDKKIRKNRSFSEAGMNEICHLHERLLSNMRLSMSVFLDGNLADAKKLLAQKVLFRDLEREYAATHLVRLQDNTPESISTSSLHLDLISELKRINSHICSIAYPILDAAGALSESRVKTPWPQSQHAKP